MAISNNYILIYSQGFQIIHSFLSYFHPFILSEIILSPLVIKSLLLLILSRNYIISRGSLQGRLSFKKFAISHNVFYIHFIFYFLLEVVYLSIH